jgi:predicted glycogen debranching enzyme
MDGAGHAVSGKGCTQAIGRIVSTHDKRFHREWLETNETGAFMAGSVAGAATRRYHNLFMVSRHPPVDRVILVNNCETFLHSPDQRLALSANLYPETVQPGGHQRIDGFDHHPWPKWTYDIPELEAKLTKELVLIHQRNIVLLKWTLTDANQPLGLSVHPKLTGREYTALHSENPDTTMDTRIDGQRLTWNPYEEIPETHGYHNGTFHEHHLWFRDNQYLEEFNYEETQAEDWWSPGRVEYQLSPGDTAWLMFSTDPTLNDGQFRDLYENEKEYRSSREDAHRQLRHKNEVTGFIRASEDFCVQRENRETIFAGYPWFTDWGRDTFISLTGLMLVPGHHDTARDILSVFGDYISNGIVPNRFPEHGDEPEYNTIDASLWYIHALGKYLSYSGDESFVTGPGWKALRKILDGYRSGTRFHIKQDEDGLIRGGTPDTQLTWMDAQVDDHSFTPRDGKPVEIQVLWIRSLDVAATIAELRDEPEHVQEYRDLRTRAIDSFRNRFWYEDGGYLYDVVDGHAGNDPSLRPNQIYAAMFDGILPDQQRRSVVDVVEDTLLTPYGLRTLSPDDSSFKGRYHGDRWERDAAYHQGTVWPFLLGGFVSAWMRTRESTPEHRQRARSFFEGLDDHLENQATIGQVSEIFDGTQPHRPKGCVAQAWSVAEPLRARFEDVYDIKPS